MSTSVGQIGLDLVVNKKQFNTQMKGIQSLAKKTGAVLASAFAVKEIVQFTSDCLKLGSDLNEVENVVNTAFPKMNKEMDAWAKKAASSFGLSETMAKRYAGTFGAMTKSFGFTEKKAYEMSTTLTGLAGDLASFYNISQDEAYTKLKSVFTGETETLKDLGVVMTQNALDAYALANGYNKTTSAMSEQEKVALRYNFVLEKLDMASGDFIRTQDSWANQVRILKLQFDSLKATLGQGFINLFTPIVKTVNLIIAKLSTLANAFKAFTELITGSKSDAGTNTFSQTQSAAEAASGAVAGVADSIDKATAAAKKNQRITMGLDELNMIPESAESSTSGGGSAAGEEVDYGSLAEGETVIDQLDESTKVLADRLTELKNICASGWKFGLGDLKVLDSIRNQAAGIKLELKEIFTDEEVVGAANRMLDKVVYAIGSGAGAFASVGLTIADNLTGGMAGYLVQNRRFIQDKIISMFDVSGELAQKTGELLVAVADIFTVFRTPAAKRITADIIGIFSNAFLETGEIALKFGRDIVGLIADPIIQNKELIKTALTDTLGPISQYTSTVRELITDTAEKISRVYDTHFAPAFQKIGDGFSEVFGAVLDAYSQYMAPALDKIAAEFKKLKDSSLQPVIDKFLDLAGNIAECIADVWTAISPFVAWMAGEFVSGISQALNSAWDSFRLTFSWISLIISGLLDTLNGLITFLTGTFTGNWTMAWEGVKMTFSGIWETIKAVFKPFSDWLQEKVIQPVTDMVAKIESTLGTVANWIQKNVLTPIQTGFAKFWEGIKKVCNAMLSGIETMVNGIVRGINRMISALNSLKFDIPEWVPGLGGKSFSLNLPSVSQVTLPRLADGGYVKKNTPQLAMIGDNRHQGEVVAPEAKLLEMARLAAESSSGNMAAVIAAIESLKEAILEGQDVPVEVVVDVDGDVIYKVVQKASRKRGVDFKMGAFER